MSCPTSHAHRVLVRALVAVLLTAICTAPAASAASPSDVKLSPQRDESAFPRQGLPPKPLNEVGLKITNGTPADGLSSHPAVGFLAELDGQNFVNKSCTVTLIGCQTVLTTATCVDGVDAGDMLVHFQHAGSFGVNSVQIDPAYNGQATSTADVAVLTLDDGVDGIEPLPINLASRPPVGTDATLVGYGAETGAGAAGIKRYSGITTSTCSAVSGDTHLCWMYDAPTGSTACVGDTGAPMLLDDGNGGYTVGGLAAESATCASPDNPWATDVCIHQDFIINAAGSDLGATCSAMPTVFSEETDVFSGSGQLSAENNEYRTFFDVPSGTDRMVVTVNADASTDFDLYIANGREPTRNDRDCFSYVPSSYETCVVDNPQPGQWNVLVDHYAGAGSFQVTATVTGSTTPDGACVPSASILCIDDEPGDSRFAVSATFDSALGGGVNGTAIPVALDGLGVTSGGLLAFFGIDNPELLVKILNGCGDNGYYWVYFSAGTNLGFTLIVVDTQTQQTWTSTNPDLTLAAPVADNAAFLCSI